MNTNELAIIRNLETIRKYEQTIENMTREGNTFYVEIIRASIESLKEINELFEK